MTDEASNAGTTPVRAGFEIDERALTDWLTANVAGFAGPLTIEQFKGGQSNPTFKLITPQRAYVLRRKPPGQILKGAHAVDREARVMAALGPLGFPVPKVHALCTDDTVIGSWFVVLEHVQGRIFWDARFPGVSTAERPQYFDAMNETLARLHAIDPASCGLADYGNPGNYLARQVSRWTRQYLEDTVAGRDPHMDRLIEWLPGALPADDGQVSVIHGDFRCDNMIFHPTEPRVLAVLDWELSTLGHPLADFAYNAMMYRMPADIVAGLAGVTLSEWNIPSEQDYVQAYCRRTGRATIDNYAFYVAFNFFRLAAIFHGIKGRVLRGSAASAQAAQRIEVFPTLARLAWEQAVEAGAR